MGTGDRSFRRHACHNGGNFHFEHHAGSLDSPKNKYVAAVAQLAEQRFRKA